MFEELAELFVLSLLPGIPIGEQSEFPAGESAKGFFLWCGEIEPKGLNAQSGFFAGCSSGGITEFDGCNCLDGDNVKSWGVTI